MGMSPQRLAVVARVMVANNLYGARKRAGMTQFVAAGLLKWEQSKLSKVESGIQPVTVDEVALLAMIYDVPFLALLAVE